jgi:hypothetical protein
MIKRTALNNINGRETLRTYSDVSETLSQQRLQYLKPYSFGRDYRAFILPEIDHWFNVIQNLSNTLFASNCVKLIKNIDQLRQMLKICHMT